jgi:hypothetical protein
MDRNYQLVHWWVLIHTSHVHLPINVVIDDPIGEGSCILLYLARAVNPTPF